MNDKVTPSHPCRAQLLGVVRRKFPFGLKCFLRHAYAARALFRLKNRKFACFLLVASEFLGRQCLSNRIYNILNTYNEWIGEIFNFPPKARFALLKFDAILSPCWDLKSVRKWVQVVNVMA